MAIPTTPHIPLTPESLSELRSEVDAEFGGEPARDGRAKGAGKGQRCRITPDGRKIPTDDIVEFCRSELQATRTDGDIKRACVKLWGGTGGAYAKHIALARKRNLAVLDRTSEVAKSESVSRWASLAKEANDWKKVGQRDLIKAQQALDSFVKEVGSSELDPDQAERLEFLQDQRTRALSFFNYWSTAVEEKQAHLDKLLGNHAPLQIKQELSDERKREIASPKEPLTIQEGDEALIGLVDQLKQRAVANDRQETTKPSGN